MALKVMRAVMSRSAFYESGRQLNGKQKEGDFKRFYWYNYGNLSKLVPPTVFQERKREVYTPPPVLDPFVW